ncbi:MAG TPA: proline dehydrogenase family protein [Bacteroidota bacterium]|nr:proline dehydrogenase family protein [Bacteroidota bacterium]
MHLLNKLVVAAVPLVPRRIIRYFAGRYIAGETLSMAVDCVRGLNREGVCATMDVLGEDISTRAEAVAARDECITVLHTIAKEHLDSNLSIKLTSLGLKIDKMFCIENVRGILTVAAGYNTFVRVDMEDSTCTSDTIDVFRAVHREFPNTGIVVQAYLFRTEEDVRSLAQDRVNFRLCKGIYKERAEIAFQGRGEVQENFMKLLGIMIDAGCYVGIATHDSVLVDGAYDLLARKNLRKDQYEFQMLLGVRPELRKKLVRDGHKVRSYVPYGEHWYGYSTRRFKENPEIAGYIFKALFTRNA